MNLDSKLKMRRLNTTFVAEIVASLQGSYCRGL